MKLFSHKKRPVHLDSYPLERLPRLSDPEALPHGLGSRAKRPVEARGEGPLSAGHAFGLYADLFDAQRSGEPAPAAPIPDDPGRASQQS